MVNRRVLNVLAKRVTNGAPHNLQSYESGRCRGEDGDALLLAFRIAEKALSSLEGGS